MVTARITDDAADALEVLGTLAEHLEELPSGPGLARSLHRIVRDTSYRFLLVEDEHSTVAAVGIVTFFLRALRQLRVLAVEALWFRDNDDTATQRAVWRTLVDLSSRMEFEAVCIAVRSTNAPQALRDLVAAGQMDGYPVGPPQEMWLQKQENPEPVSSAFSDTPIGSAVFRAGPLVAVLTRIPEIDFSGREYTGAGPLYRGEGRLENEPYWTCANLDELAAVHFRAGFPARPRALPVDSTAPFSGSIAEQLLHQGYVGQGAVSLSSSFEVAANYATHAGRHESGVVFAISASRLRERTRLFDASATLAAACPWIGSAEWTPLRRVVRALWSETESEAAGRFLQRCYEETFRHVHEVLPPRPDVRGYLSREALAAVEAVGVTADDLLRVHDVFETFANFAQGQIGSVDTLHPDDSPAGYTVETKLVDPMAYFVVFDRIADALREHRPDARLGWDTTPMGYLAKTARDDEIFAGGAVPGEAIIEAYVVDRAGRRVRRITPAVP